MKREFSAGGVVFKKDKQQVKILLIRNYKPDREVNYWGFPKGHLEEGEKSMEAALREVEEETSVEAKVVSKIDRIEYFFKWEGETIFKNVTMFLMEYVSGEVRFQNEELAEAGWFTPEESLDKISFDKDRKILLKAMEMINGQ